MVKTMRARTLIWFSRGIAVALCAAAFSLPPSAIASSIIKIDLGQPTLDLNLSLAIGGTPVAASSTVSLPIGKDIPVSISASTMSGDGSILDGSQNSYTYWDAFYLDFYKGTPFSGATFLSGEQMNATSSTLKSASTVMFPGPGTYSAVLYDSLNMRDYAAMCNPVSPCSPATPLDQIRGAIGTWPESGAAPLGPIGVVTFTVSSSDPCAAPGSCVSNVLFLPGIEMSRLYYRDMLGIEHQVWEPDLFIDVPFLALNADGTSKYPLYTKDKDIVDTFQAHNPLWSTITSVFHIDLEAYGGFEHFMDALVTSGTIKEWRAYPYDWRYDVRDIVQNGTPTKEPDGSVQQVYLTNVLEDMASSSPTGKVTVIAHSNGGLLAKALADALGASAPRYIDRIITIGTPQWGTPSGIGAILHGDDGTNVFGLVTSSSDVRAVAATMPGSYGLLPSPAYFTHVSDPVVTFNTDGSLSGTFASHFGKALSSFSAFVNFITDAAGLDAQAGSAADLRTPLALRSTLLDKEVATHSVLDAWVPPPGITMTAIAGWGQDTVKTLAYSTVSKVICTDLVFSLVNVCADTAELEHTPVLTQDGDGTVVSPSAAGDTGDRLYFDSLLFGKNESKKVAHQNLTSANPIQKVIADLLTDKDPAVEPYITSDKPSNGTHPITLRISSHSPVHLITTDADGNQSGVLPVPGTDFSGVKRDIPGSSVQVFDDEEYINVPESGTYRVAATGYAPGSATLAVDTVGSDGTITASTTFADIPTQASSTDVFAVIDGVPTAPAVDLNGDGTIDFTAASSSPASDALAYVRYMRTVVKAMSLSVMDARFLDGKLADVERRLAFAQRESDDIAKSEGRAWSSGEKWHTPSKQKSLINDLELTMLTRYVEMQVKLSTLNIPYERSTHLGMSAVKAEVILAMINRLKALL